MKKLKLLVASLLAVLAVALCPTIAKAEGVTYETEYYDSIQTAIYVYGLDNNLEDGYNYYIYITQDAGTTADTVFSKASMANCDGLTYDPEGNRFYLKTSAHNIGVFEKAGDYYVFIVKGRIGYKSSFSLLDGPTKLARPESLPAGERMTIFLTENGVSYYINQYDYYTKMYGTNRKMKFYLGEITDPTLLTKLANETADAYELLYAYALEHNNYLYSGSFDTTSSGVVNYNIFSDYAQLVKGKYYFVYYKLDDENGTYINVDDVQAYEAISPTELIRLTTYTMPTFDDAVPNTSAAVEEAETSTTVTTVSALPQAGSSSSMPLVAIALSGTVIVGISVVRWRRR